MDFFRAMQELEYGERIKNVNWEVTEYIYVDDENGLIKDQDNKHVGLVMASNTQSDIWEVYEEPETLLFFTQLLPLLLEGKKFKRKGWEEEYIMGVSKGFTILLYLPEGEITPWTPKLEDLFSIDWVEVEE